MKRVDRFVYAATFLAIAVLIFASAVAAWFVLPRKEFGPTFSASIVKAYFDAESIISEDNPSDCMFIISKPVHLYNLAYLTNQGVFSAPTNFQFGKQKDNSTDLGFYVYPNNTADEISDEELTSTILDMSVYTVTEDGIPPIGVGSLAANSVFNHTLAGNGITVSGYTVKDHMQIGGSDVYFSDVGMFGVVADGASVSNFNVLGLTLTTSASNSELVNCGLVAGYLNQSETGVIVFENIGVADSRFSTRSKVYSEFAFVGNGTPTGLSTANNFFITEEASGDTGVVNIDQIYFTVRDNVGDSAVTGTTATGTSQAYFKINGYKSGNIYESYTLRDTDGDPITRYNRGVDFRGRQVIHGNDENALGVFDLATADKDSDADFTTAFDKFALKTLNYNGSQYFDKFFYSTAEYYNPEQNFGVYNGVSSWTATAPAAGVLSPSTYDPNTLTTNAYYYEAAFDPNATTNYFNDTRYTYLREHLKDTLVDLRGDSVAETDPEFGVAAKYVDAGVVRNIERMYMILKLARYSGSEGYTANTYQSDGFDWVESSVYFTLSRDANVTVFASSKDVSGTRISHVGIYDHDTTVSSSVSNIMRHPMYTMYVPGGSFYYYPAGGDDTTEPVQQTSIAVFAHTFKLPAGRYFLNTPDAIVSLMHISVQGQDGGGMGDIGREGFSVDYVPSDELSIMVGSEDYVYSQTAFKIGISDPSSFDALFTRVKNIDADSDIVYALVAETASLDYISRVNADRGVIALGTAPRSSPP